MSGGNVIFLTSSTTINRIVFSVRLNSIVYYLGDMAWTADPHSTGLYAAVGAGDGGSFGTDPAGRKLYDAGSRCGGLRAGCAARYWKNAR